MKHKTATRLKIKGERILLTGGAGFIGTNLIRRLAPDNNIVVFDNLSRNGLERLPAALRRRLTVIQGDVLDGAALLAAAKGTTMVVHLAAIAGVDTVLRYPARTMEVAMLGTYHAAQAALKQPKLKRFIDFSTSEVFGQFAFQVQECDVTSLGAVGEARWTYAVSKLATEHLVHNYYKEQGLPAVSIRPFNIYGPGQIGGGAIKAFVEAAISRRPLRINNDGSQIRSWCYIDDIIDAVCLALTEKRAVGQAFNIGNPQSTITTYNLAQLVKEIARSRSRLAYYVNPQVDVELRVPDIRKARELLGYAPRVDLREGIRRTIAWYHAQAR